uniref:Secreted protein n=1 Tax=Romanomermis culicivorax TaxID=13658 RepID=A0A915IAJ2_ROMCU
MDMVILTLCLQRVLSTMLPYGAVQCHTAHLCTVLGAVGVCTFLQGGAAISAPASSAPEVKSKLTRRYDFSHRLIERHRKWYGNVLLLRRWCFTGAVFSPSRRVQQILGHLIHQGTVGGQSSLKNCE